MNKNADDLLTRIPSPEKIRELIVFMQTRIKQGLPLESTWSGNCEAAWKVSDSVVSVVEGIGEEGTEFTLVVTCPGCSELLANFQKGEMVELSCHGVVLPEATFSSYALMLGALRLQAQKIYVR